MTDEYKKTLNLLLFQIDCVKIKVLTVMIHVSKILKMRDFHVQIDHFM